MLKNTIIKKGFHFTVTVTKIVGHKRSRPEKSLGDRVVEFSSSPTIRTINVVTLRYKDVQIRKGEKSKRKKHK